MGFARPCPVLWESRVGLLPGCSQRRTHTRLSGSPHRSSAKFFSTWMGTKIRGGTKVMGMAARELRAQDCEVTNPATRARRLPDTQGTRSNPPQSPATLIYPIHRSLPELVALMVTMPPSVLYSFRSAQHVRATAPVQTGSLL